MKKKRRKRRRNKWKRKGKSGARPMGDREAQREKRRDEEFDHIVKNLDSLGNPYDQMDINTKKLHALSMYYEKVKVLMLSILKIIHNSGEV